MPWGMYRMVSSTEIEFERFVYKIIVQKLLYIIV